MIISGHIVPMFDINMQPTQPIKQPRGFDLHKNKQLQPKQSHLISNAVMFEKLMAVPKPIEDFEKIAAISANYIPRDQPVLDMFTMLSSLS